MRVLFAFAGGSGHLLPLVPLARAAASAGHDVVFAGQAGAAAAVAAEGFAFVATGGATLRTAPERTALEPLDEEREARVVRDTFAGRDRARARGGGRRGARGARVRPRRLRRGRLRRGRRRGGGGAAVRDRPLHRRQGSCGRSSSRSRCGSYARRTGCRRDARTDAPVLTPFPPSLRPPGRTHPFRSVEARSEPRTTVLVTLGTIFVLESGDLLERVVAGVARLPLEVVATVGRDLDPAALGPQPPNVRVERYVPQAELLPRCALAVSHGGSGSVVGALAHGVPMVLLPLGADQPLNARRCAELGVARVLDAATATPDEIAGAARAVLADGACRAAAGRIRDEIAGLPDPAEAVRRLERLA